MGVVHYVHTQKVYLPGEDLLELKCHPYVSPMAFQALSSSVQILSILSRTVVMYLCIDCIWHHLSQTNSPLYAHSCNSLETTFNVNMMLVCNRECVEVVVMSATFFPLLHAENSKRLSQCIVSLVTGYLVCSFILIFGALAFVSSKQHLKNIMQQSAFCVIWCPPRFLSATPLWLFKLQVITASKTHYVITV